MSMQFASWSIIERARAISKSFTKSLISTVGANLGITFATTIGGILAARFLGPEGRGELATAVVWAGVLSGIAQLGLPQALTYFTAKEPDAVGNIFSTTMWIWLAQTIGVLVVGWFAAGALAYSKPTVVDIVRLYLFSIPFSLSITYMSTIAQGLKRFALFNGLRILSAVGYPIALCLVYIFDLKTSQSVIVFLLATHVLLAGVSAVWFLVKVMPVGHFSRLSASRILGYGLRSYWGSLSWMANVRLEQFFMIGFLALDELGYYTVAVSYASVLFPLSSAFAMVLFPDVARDSQRDARARISKTFKLNLAVSGGTAAFLALVCPILLPFVFGASFRPAVGPAVILVGGTVVLGCNYVLSDGLRGLGLPTPVSAAELVGVIVTVIGLWTVVPRLGINGAALVSLISYTVVCSILFASYRRYVKGLPTQASESAPSQSVNDD